jgi:uncharacterized protein YegL
MMPDLKNTYTAAELSKLLKVSTETVRTRAKAGKIPFTKNSAGRLVFEHNALVAAGVLTIVSKGSTPILTPKTKNLTDVFFVLDRSGSMGGLESQTRASLRAQIKALKEAAGANDEYRITVINFDGRIDVTLTRQDVEDIGLGEVDALYLRPSGSTNLYGAVHRALELAEKADDGKRAFLISILTDGGETDYVREIPTKRIKTATATDRYTFVYAGPRNSESQGLGMGIPAGNVTTWDQTDVGVQTLSRSTVSSLGTYTNSRSQGITKSTSFYAQPNTKDAGKFAKQLSSKLGALDSKAYQVERVSATDPIVIKAFCEKKFGTFPKGKIYYELTESEKVQDYKKVVIQDKATGNFYAGEKQAMGLLGIPNFTGTVRIKPGNLGEFKMFVQSTSYNRKLNPGTAVVYLK